MATTLAEYSKLSNDVLLKGVIETILYTADTLQKLPFSEIQGNALTYNRENASAGAQFYSPGDTWVEGTPTFTQQTETITILGGDADIDNFIKNTRSNVQDVEAATLELKVKAVADLFNNTFINGDTDTDPKSFNGLADKIGISGSQYITMATNGTTLTLTKLDELIDAVKPGKPDALIMSKRSRRKISALLRADGSGIMETDRDMFGRQVYMYGGIPISENDWIPNTETCGAGSAISSSIYAVQYGENALCGLTNKWIETINLGELETKDAKRFRIRWYCGLALFSAYAVARLAGVQD